ncbi:hypothetical protein SEPCBS119000_002919 [Sporothrix epigloea]|uniref:Uncharacterized protein n=1 Tax=Sporothrix epigloea TaxID=1892477 RepID=A0ABP0DMZ5_9PEZI
MAPVRRYLRISKYSVLECHIYVDNPALVPSWLLHPRNPVLPRVIESVRPLVLPKLMEERERAKKKGTKKKGAIRDVLVEDDFEVSLFLTETTTRHSLLYKHRRARDKTQTRLVSNSSKLTGATSDAPIEIGEGGGSNDLRIELDQDGAPDSDTGDGEIVLTAASVGGGQSVGQNDAPTSLLLEDSDDEAPMALKDIPDIQSARPIKVEDDENATIGPAVRRSKRRREEDSLPIDDSDGGGDDDGDSGSLFVSENEGLSDLDSDADVDVTDKSAPNRTRAPPPQANTYGDDTDSKKKKKLAMDVIYEGFAIYGRVLCLVVKRRGGPMRGRGVGGGTQTTLSASIGSGQAGNALTGAEPLKPGGQAAMENWIASTQMPAAQADGIDMS